MKHAFLCCIHGNLQALEAVEQDIAACAPDRIWCLGDVVGYGAQPRECLDLVLARGWPTLLGNHEEMVNDSSEIENWAPAARAAIYYTMGAVTAEQRAWMRRLPESIEVDGIQLVHGSTHGRRPRQYILKPEDAAAAFAAASRPLVFHGHTHIAMTFHHGDPIEFSKDPIQRLAPGARALVDVGSVGQPRDRDARASWVLYDTEKREIAYRRVAYDAAEASRRIRAAGLPEKLAQRLVDGV